MPQLRFENDTIEDIQNPIGMSAGESEAMSALPQLEPALHASPIIIKVNYSPAQMQQIYRNTWQAKLTASIHEYESESGTMLILTVSPSWNNYFKDNNRWPGTREAWFESIANLVIFCSTFQHYWTSKIPYIEYFHPKETFTNINNLKVRWDIVLNSHVLKIIRDLPNLEGITLIDDRITSSRWKCFVDGDLQKMWVGELDAQLVAKYMEKHSLFLESIRPLVTQEFYHQNAPQKIVKAIGDQQPDMGVFWEFTSVFDTTVYNRPNLESRRVRVLLRLEFNMVLKDNPVRGRKMLVVEDVETVAKDLPVQKLYEILDSNPKERQIQDFSKYL